MSIYQQINHNKLRTWLIMLLFIGLFSGFFFIVGNYLGSSIEYLIIGFLFSLVSAGGSYFYSDRIVLWSTGARLATKKEFFNFYTVTENLAMADGLPMPKLYVIDDPAPNAFATGRNPKHAVVCATTGLLNMMDRTELEGVVAHELSHVKNWDILVSSIVAVLVGTIALAADWILRTFWYMDDDSDKRSPIFFVLFIIVLVIVPIVATLIQLAVSRQREFLADADGALLTRYPDGLARALEKIKAYPRPMKHATTSTAHLFISSPFKKEGISSMVSSLFATHPPIDERIKILRDM